MYGVPQKNYVCVVQISRCHPIHLHVSVLLSGCFLKGKHCSVLVALFLMLLLQTSRKWGIGLGYLQESLKLLSLM